jgi:hypothetical protein
MLAITECPNCWTNSYVLMNAAETVHVISHANKLTSLGDARLLAIHWLEKKLSQICDRVFPWHSESSEALPTLQMFMPSYLVRKTSQ